MRHAKSDWDAEYSADHERPLNERGLRSARLMGRVISDLGLAPDLILSSTAVRARITAELAKEAGGWNCPIELVSELYETGPETVLQIVSEAPFVDRLMVIGHNPTWNELVRRLTGEEVEMKTATVAVVEMRDGWAGSGSFVTLHHPRDYEGT